MKSTTKDNRHAEASVVDAINSGHEDRQGADRVVAANHFQDLTQHNVSSPIRIAYLIDNLGVAGTEQWLLRLIANLDRSRITPFLCLLDGMASGSQELEPDGIPVLRLGVKKLGSLAALAAARHFIRFLKAEKIDVVQLHFADSTYFGAPLSWWAGVKRIVGTSRNAGYWLTPMHRRRSRFAARFLTDVIANSTASLEAAREIYPYRRIRTAVIQNGIDLERFRDVAPLRTEKPVNDKWRVGIVANLRPIKDLPTFIHAAAELLKTMPDVEFLIAGEGPERTRLEQLIASLGLQDDVRLLGAIDNVPAFLGRLDVAVLCSKSEGCSNSLIEYMAASRPVIATAIGSVEELIETGRDGTLCTPGDPNALANSIAHVLLDRTFAQNLASSANRKCILHFTKQREIRDYSRFVLMHAKHEVV